MKTKKYRTLDKTKRSILLVEDNYNFGNILRDNLELKNYNIILARDGIEGFQFFEKHEFDLCILDVMMPQMDGFTLAEKIRDIDESIPIFFLTAKNIKEDVLKGYKVGADDYLVKPFDTDVLHAKIKSILIRKSVSGKLDTLVENFEFGSYTFNSRLRLLKHSNGDPVELSHKEASLLHLLLSFKNDLLTREVALNKIWGRENYYASRTMDVYMVRLRKKLKEDDSVKIKNIHGLGFQLITYDDVKKNNSDEDET